MPPLVIEGPPTLVVPFTVIVSALVVAALIEAFPSIAIGPLIVVAAFIAAGPATVNCVGGVVPPTAPLKVKRPLPFEIRAKAPFKGPLIETAPLPALIVVSAASVVAPRAIAAFVVFSAPRKNVGPAVCSRPPVNDQAVGGAPFSLSIPVVANVAAGVKAQPALNVMFPAVAASA